eukprot:PLAT11661.19.p1 GENE.PLAT11661.19~~PLAT11661.19.p1  ORF type:complete len:692 (-),score=367.16 PLAT11661.19:177-2204(-)
MLTQQKRKSCKEEEDCSAACSSLTADLLPTDVVRSVLAFLDAADVMRAAAACSGWDVAAAKLAPPLTAHGAWLGDAEWRSSCAARLRRCSRSQQLTLHRSNLRSPHVETLLRGLPELRLFAATKCFQLNSLEALQAVLQRRPVEGEESEERKEKDKLAAVPAAVVPACAAPALPPRQSDCSSLRALVLSDVPLPLAQLAACLHQLPCLRAMALTNCSLQLPGADGGQQAACLPLLLAAAPRLQLLALGGSTLCTEDGLSRDGSPTFVVGGLADVVAADEADADGGDAAPAVRRALLTHEQLEVLEMSGWPDVSTHAVAAALPAGVHLLQLVEAGVRPGMMENACRAAAGSVRDGLRLWSAAALSGLHDCELSAVLGAAASAITAPLQRTPLHTAALSGNAAALAALLALRPDVEPRDVRGCTPLLRAAQRGHDACVDLLLRAGASLWLRSQTLETALLAAASKGHASCVALLLAAELQREGDCRAAGDDGERPRSATCSYYDGWTPLHQAIVADSLDAMASLLSAGHDGNRVNKYQQTALHVACRLGRVAAIAPLLRSGCRLEAVDESGCTALEVAKAHSSAGVDAIAAYLAGLDDSERAAIELAEREAQAAADARGGWRRRDGRAARRAKRVSGKSKAKGKGKKQKSKKKKKEKKRAAGADEHSWRGGGGGREG